MSAKSKRHDTLRAIIRGSSLFILSVDFGKVDSELTELIRCSKLQTERRKRLLQALHATRALDTTLGAILTIHGQSPDHSLGPRFNQIANLPSHLRGYLPHSAVAAFKRKICDKRNIYVHVADAYPTSTHEVDTLVAEIEAVISALL